MGLQLNVAAGGPAVRVVSPRPVLPPVPMKLTNMGPDVKKDSVPSTFEHILVTSQWPSEHWIVPKLAAYQGLDPVTAWDYTLVKAAILDFLCISKKRHSCCFWSETFMGSMAMGGGPEI